MIMPSEKVLEIISSIPDDVIKKAIDRWGMEPQFRMIQEECAELISAINHALRASRHDEAIDELIGEFADVIITLQNLFVFFEDIGKMEDLQDHINKKMIRVMKRLNKSSNL